MIEQHVPTYYFLCRYYIGTIICTTMYYLKSSWKEGMYVGLSIRMLTSAAAATAAVMVILGTMN